MWGVLLIVSRPITSDQLPITINLPSKYYKRFHMKYYNFILYLLLLFALTQQACSQTYATKKTAEGKAKKLYDRAMQYRKDRQYDKAMKELASAIKANPNFIDAYIQLANFQLGEQQWQSASNNLEKAIALDATYEPKAYYYLGVANWEQDKYDQAAKSFDAFLYSYTSKKGTLREKAQVYLRNSQFAATAIKNPVPFDPKPLSASINTANPEYLPSITADGNTLIFTRNQSRQEDVFQSEFKNGQWQTAQPLVTINTDDNEGSAYISANGQYIVFNRRADDGYGNHDLYFSEKQGSTWSTPVNMGPLVNTKYWEAQPSLSADGQLLYFTSNRPEGQGGYDIWLTYRRSDGEWAKPINLGKEINTPFDDETPFYHPDGQTLYFMSKGHAGMGDYDLYVSRRTNEGSWGEPTNLGYPINTKAREGALFITLDGKTAYFTKGTLTADGRTNRQGEPIKQPDIYSFELPAAVRANPVTYVQATVKEAGTNNILADANIELIELQTNTILSTSKTDKKGNFLTTLPLGNDYALNVNKTSYLFHSENFSLSQTASLDKPYQLQIELYPIPEKTTALPEKAKPIILKNVFFETGSADLKSTSIAELTRLKELLEEHPALNIQINGHTDNVGSDSDNILLSEQRAKAVQDYLIQNGIAANRLLYKGYGENQPIDTNDTEVGRKNNRRTEFILR